MGLFDRLIKEGQKALNSVASDENKEKAVNLFNGVMAKVEETAKELASEENKEKASMFLDDVKNKVESTAKEIASDENREKVSSFLNSLKSNITDLKEDIKEEETKKEYFVPDVSDKTCREKLLEVLSEEFPRYKVAENVSPTTIGGTGRFMNYSIAVYDELTPKLFIMIIGKTTTSHREYRWSREEAAKHGVAFLNFVNHYPNHKEYISERLHKYL